MKKFFILLLLLAGLNINAQEIETLIPKEVKPDPMTGNSGGTAWIGEHIFLYETKGDASIVLCKPKHIFVSGGQPKLGYYNRNDSLIAMGGISSALPMEDGSRMRIWAFFSTDSLPHGEYSENKFYSKKSWRVLPSDLLKWLKETDGYARIVVSTYGQHLFDVRFRLKRDN